MRVKRLLAVAMLIAVMLIVFAGCGGSAGTSSDASAAGTVAESTAPAQAETIVQAATEQIAEAVDTKTKADALVGSWVDVNAADRFVNITTDGTAYKYEDNEGVLPATFEDGVLNISVSDTDKAKAYIDQATGHLMVVYQDNISEYSKKQ